MAALEGKAASGFAKLPPDFLFEDLPPDSSDIDWVRIENDYGLSFPEIRALKNARCQQAAAQQAAAAPQGPSRVTGEGLDFMSELVSAKILKDGGESYLPMTHLIGDTNTMIKTPDRGIFGKDGRLVVRSFYSDFSDEILQNIPLQHIYRIYVTGTPGVGKTTFRNYIAWKILHDFRLKKEAVRIALHKGGIDSFYLLCLESDGSYRVEEWTTTQLRRSNRLLPDFKLGQNFVALSDVSEGNSDHCDVFTGGSIIFSSPNPKTWRQGSKDNCQFFFMPLWEEGELCRFDPNGTFKTRFERYGGVVRVVWGVESNIKNYENRLFRKEIQFAVLHAQVKSTSWESVPHRLIYLIVNKDSEGKYQWCSEPTLAFPTRHLARLLGKKYVDEIMNSYNHQFGMDHATVYGLLFESVVLELIAHHHDVCKFNIYRLGSSKGKKLPLVSKDQLTIPKGMELVNFDTIDFMSVISTGCVLALPNSNYFPGFDAAISFEYGTGRYGRKNTNRVLVLIQVTIAITHPLSHEGLLKLEETHKSNNFQTIMIIYLVPSNNSKSFGLQKLKKPQQASVEQKNIFMGTPQIAMCIDINKRVNKKQKGQAAAGN